MKNLVEGYYTAPLYRTTAIVALIPEHERYTAELQRTELWQKLKGDLEKNAGKAN